MIGAIINFCSNDAPYLWFCIERVRPFVSQILVPVCDHFFDGVEENREKLHGIFAEHPTVHFIEYPYQGSLYACHPPSYWHNLSRLIAAHFLAPSIEYVLFLDCDEIIEPEPFANWLASCEYQKYRALRLANYWYFRDPAWRAKSWEDTPLMIRKEELSAECSMHPLERAGMFSLVQDLKVRTVLSCEDTPMIHHYSWVRTKEQLLRKVQSWGHAKDRNWTALVEEEFSRPFDGRDFVHGYSYEKVEPNIALDLSYEPDLIKPRVFPHVKRLTPEEMMQIDLKMHFDC